MYIKPIITLLVILLLFTGYITMEKKKEDSFFFILMSSLLIGVLSFSIYSFTRTNLIPFNSSEAQRSFLLTGDEPAYLYTAYSIAKDRDLDLSNNNRDKDYLVFQSRPVGSSDFNFFNSIAKGRLTDKKEAWGNSQYMKHRPGFSCFISPIFKYANHNHRWFIYTATSLVLSIFLALSFFIGVHTLNCSPAAAFVICLTSGLAPPVLFYANQAYPELIVGVVLALASLGIASGKKGYLLITTILLSLIIWFSDRALIPVAILALACLLRCSSNTFRCILVVPLIISGAGFAYYCMHRFGVPYPVLHTNIYGFSWDIIHQRILQIFFDSKQGWIWLFPPALLLPAVILQTISFKKENIAQMATTLAIIAALILLASFDDWRGGTNPRGRYYVIPQILFTALLIYWFIMDRGRTGVKLFWLVILGTLALSQIPWLSQNPKWWYANYHPLFSWKEIQHFYGYLPSLPDKAPAEEWKKLITWLPLLAIPSITCLFSGFLPKKPRY